MQQKHAPVDRGRVRGGIGTVEPFHHPPQNLTKSHNSVDSMCVCVQNDRMDDDSEILQGGNVGGPVVRVGATVHKQLTPASPSVHPFLHWLNLHRYQGAPRLYGRSPDGRYQVLEYVPGTMADRLPPLTETELHQVGALIRSLHDLSARYPERVEPVWEPVIPPRFTELVCHNDLAPWNLVRGEERWVFIDWDAAGLGNRMEDLGYAAHGFVPLHPGGDPVRDARRLRVLADGYGCDLLQRRDLPEATLHKVRGMFWLLEEGARTGCQPWARLHAEGHADHWGPAASYVAEHLETWRAALTRG